MQHAAQRQAAVRCYCFAPSSATKLQRPPVRRQQQQQQQDNSIPLLSLSSLSPQLQLLVQQRQQEERTAAPLLPHPLCELDPGALSRRISQCSSWRDAAVLFAQQAPCLNHINLSALLVKLAHLPDSGDSRPANWQPFVHQVLVASQPLLQSAQPRQLANMAWALSKLGLTQWVGGAGAATHAAPLPDSHQQQQQQQADLSSSSNGSQSWALGNGTASGSAVAAAWGHAWQQQALRSLHSATCFDVSNMLWALATSTSASGCASTATGVGAADAATGAAFAHQQQHQPQQQLLQELLSALHRTLPSSTPQDVANALWALATLQPLRVSEELTGYLLIRVQAHAADLKPCELATTLWALSRLQVPLPSSLLQECLLRQVGRPQWQHTQLRHWVMCLSACAHLKQVPPSAWLNDCLQHLQEHMPQAYSPQQQQQQPTPTQQQQQQQQPAATPAAAAATPLSCGDSSSNSSSQSSASLASSSSSSSTTRLSSQDLSNTIWALAALRIKPHESWMAGFLSASAASLAAATPQELANSMWGLQVLGVTPDAVWLAAFDTASLRQMPHFTPQGLGDVLAAQVRLGLKPSCVWCEAWAAALKASWGSADAPAVCKTLWAAAKCQVPLGRAWLSEALQQVHEPLLLPALAAQAVSPEELLRLMWAVGRLCRGILSQELSNVLGLYCCRAAGKMSGSQLARGAWGLARLVPLPRAGTLSYFHDLSESKLRYMPAQDAALLQEKLALLRDAAAKAEHWGANWRALLLHKQQLQQPGEGQGEEGLQQEHQEEVGERAMAQQQPLAGSRN